MRRRYAGGGSHLMHNVFPGRCTHCEINVPKGAGRLHRYTGSRKSVVMCPDCKTLGDSLQSSSMSLSPSDRQYDTQRMREHKRLAAEYSQRRGSNKGKTLGQEPEVTERADDLIAETLLVPDLGEGIVSHTTASHAHLDKILSQGVIKPRNFMDDSYYGNKKRYRRGEV